MTHHIVLLVEDDPDDELLIRRALEGAGIAYRVDVAHDGVEALDYLFGRGDFSGRDTEELPVFVLLDLSLPKLDGHQVLRQIRADERTHGVPVVVLTSSTREEDIVRSYEGGANSFVRKPVGTTEFVEVVSQLGLYWPFLNHLDAS